MARNAQSAPSGSFDKKNDGQEKNFIFTIQGKQRRRTLENQEKDKKTRKGQQHIATRYVSSRRTRSKVSFFSLSLYLLWTFQRHIWYNVKRRGRGNTRICHLGMTMVTKFNPFTTFLAIISRSLYLTVIPLSLYRSLYDSLPLSFSLLRIHTHARARTHARTCEACLPSWCIRTHVGRVSQRYRFESPRGEWALFLSCRQLYLSSFSDTHTHTRAHTQTQTHTHTHRWVTKVFVLTDTRRPYPRSVIGSTVGAYPRGPGSNPVEGNGHFFPHTVGSIFRLSLTHTHKLFLALRLSQTSPPPLSLSLSLSFYLSLTHPPLSPRTLKRIVFSEVTAMLLPSWRRIVAVQVYQARSENFRSLMIIRCIILRSKQRQRRDKESLQRRMEAHHNSRARRLDKVKERWASSTSKARDQEILRKFASAYNNKYTRVK